MIKLTSLCDYLDQLFQKELFKDYCPNGLQIEGREEVRSVATAVTASLQVIKRAVEAGADMLIVHHGLFWQGDSLPLIGTKKEKFKLLLGEGISLAAYHLPMDAHKELGNNWRAALEMGWNDLEPFGNYNGQPIGVKGKFALQSVETFQKSLETYYRHKAHSALGGKKEVSTAALVSGGAYKSLTEAAKEGVDCFITGNFDEPAWHQAHEEKIHFFAMGHAATEEIGPKALALHLKEKFGLKTSFLEEENPF